MPKKTQKEIIKETIDELKGDQSNVILDDEFEPSLITSRKLTPGMFRKDPDEVAVDELLSGLSNKNGWYLKLSKEVAAGEYQFKIKIDKFEHWADLELEIVNIVRSNTKRDRLRWGSGRYMVVAWNENGVRDKKPPKFIEVDAEEPVDVTNPAINPTVVPGTTPNEQMEAFAKLLSLVSSLHPSQSPEKTMDLVSQSYMKGMETAGQKESSGNQMTMFMMTMMMGMMKEMITGIRSPQTAPSSSPNYNDSFKEMLSMMNQLGIIGQKPEKGPDIIDQIAKFKSAGLIPTPASTDPVDQITKLKSIFSLFSELNPGVERPGLWEKLLDGLIPILPGLLGNANAALEKIKEIKGMQPQSGPAPGNGTYIEYPPANPQQQELFPPLRTEEVPIASSPVLPTASNPHPTTSTNQKEKDVNIANVIKFSNELYKIVLANDTGKYDYITGVLKSFFGNTIQEGILMHVMNEQTLVGYIKQFDPLHYKNDQDMNKLITFVKGYVEYVLRSNPVSNTFNTQCIKCGAISEFDSKEQYEKSNKICGYEQGGNICDGKLEIIA